MKIKIVDRKYGCFQVECLCEICKKRNRVFDFSYSSDGICIVDTKKIQEVVQARMMVGGHFYCMRCGNKILGKEGENNAEVDRERI